MPTLEPRLVAWPCTPTALGDSAARLAQLLLDRVGVVVAIDVDCGRGQRALPAYSAATTFVSA